MTLPPLQRITVKPRDLDPALWEIHCHDCGRFVDIGKGHFHFIPLNEFGPEESWWICPKCNGETP